MGYLQETNATGNNLANSWDEVRKILDMAEVEQHQSSEVFPVSIDSYHQIEIEEVFTSLRVTTTSRVQIYTFFGTANITVLGLALGINSAGLILIAACMIGLLAIIDRQIRSYQHLLLNRGIELENMYSLDKERACFHIYAVETRYGHPKQIRKYSILILIFSIEVAMAILSWALLKWIWF